MLFFRREARIALAVPAAADAIATAIIDAPPAWVNKLAVSATNRPTISPTIMLVAIILLMTFSNSSRLAMLCTVQKLLNNCTAA